MGRKVYISDDLDRKLEQLQKFGNFGTKVEASEKLAVLLSKIPLEVLFQENNGGEKEEQGEYISLV